MQTYNKSGRLINMVLNVSLWFLRIKHKSSKIIPSTNSVKRFTKQKDVKNDIIYIFNTEDQWMKNKNQTFPNSTKLVTQIPST